MSQIPSIPLFQPTITAGRVVKLDDGRIGVVDCVRPSPCFGEMIDRAYVVGVKKEFADWVLLNQIDHVFGVAEATAAASA